MEADSPEDNPSPCLIVVDSQDSADINTREKRLQELDALKGPGKSDQQTDDEVIPPTQDEATSNAVGSRSKRQEDTLLKAYISTPSETVGCLTLSGEVLVQETSDDTVSTQQMSGEDIPMIIPGSPTEHVTKGKHSNKVEEDDEFQVPDWQKALNEQEEVTSSKEASSTSNSLTTSESTGSSSYSASSPQLLQNWQDMSQADSSLSARPDLGIQVSLSRSDGSQSVGPDNSVQVVGEVHSGRSPHSTSDGVESAGSNVAKSTRKPEDNVSDVSSSQDLRLHLTQSQPETDAEGLSGHVDAAFKRSFEDDQASLEQLSQSEFVEKDNPLSKQHPEGPIVTSSNAPMRPDLRESGRTVAKGMTEGDTLIRKSRSLDYENISDVISKGPTSSSQPSLHQVRGVKGQTLLEEVKGQQEQPLTPSSRVGAMSKESLSDSSTSQMSGLSFHLNMMRDGSRISPFETQGRSALRHSTPIIPEVDEDLTTSGENKEEDPTVSTSNKSLMILSQQSAPNSQRGEEPVFHLSVPSKEQIEAIKESPTKRNVSVFSRVQNASFSSAKQLTLQDEAKVHGNEEDDPFMEVNNASADTILVNISGDTQTYGIDDSPSKEGNDQGGGTEDDISMETSGDRPMVVGGRQGDRNNNSRQTDLEAEQNNDMRYTQVRDPYDFTDSQSNLVMNDEMMVGSRDVHRDQSPKKKSPATSRKKRIKGRQTKGRTTANNGAENGHKKDQGGELPPDDQAGLVRTRSGDVAGQQSTALPPKRQSSSTSTSSGSNKLPSNPTLTYAPDTQEEFKYFFITANIRERWVAGRLVSTSWMELSRDPRENIESDRWSPSPAPSLSSGYLGDVSSSMGSRSSSNTGSLQKSLSMGSKSSSSTGSFGKELSPVKTPSPPVQFRRKGSSSTSSSKSSVHFSPELEQMPTRPHSPPKDSEFKEPEVSSLKKYVSPRAEEVASTGGGGRGRIREKRASKRTRRRSNHKDTIVEDTGTVQEEQRLGVPHLDREPQRGTRSSPRKGVLREAEGVTESSMSTALPHSVPETAAGTTLDSSKDDESLLDRWEQEMADGQTNTSVEAQRTAAAKGADRPSESPKTSDRGYKNVRKGVSKEPQGRKEPSRPGVKGHKKRGKKKTDSTKESPGTLTSGQGNQTMEAEADQTLQPSGKDRRERKAGSEMDVRITTESLQTEVGDGTVGHEDIQGEDESLSELSKETRNRTRGGRRKDRSRDDENVGASPLKGTKDSRGRKGVAKAVAPSPKPATRAHGRKRTASDKGDDVAGKPPEKVRGLERTAKTGGKDTEDRGMSNGKGDGDARESPEQGTDSVSKKALTKEGGQTKGGRRKSPRTPEKQQSPKEPEKDLPLAAPEPVQSGHPTEGEPTVPPIPDQASQDDPSVFEVLEAPPPSEPPTETQASAASSDEILRPGRKVLSKWPENSFYYPSIINKWLHGNKYQVLFDDMSIREVTRGHIITKDWLSKGQPVFMTMEDDFVRSAIIVGYYRNSQTNIPGYLVEDEKGICRRVTKTQVLLTKQQAHDLVSSNTSSCSDVTLDNILVGKRSTRSSYRSQGSPSPGAAKKTRTPRTVKKKPTEAPVSAGQDQPDKEDAGTPEGVSHTLMSVQTTTAGTSGSTPRSGVKRRMNVEPENRDMPARKRLTLISAESPSPQNAGSLSPLRRSLRSQASPSPSDPLLPKSRTLFKGYTFLLTYVEKSTDSDESRDTIPFSKSASTKQIQAGGGTMLRDVEKARVSSGRVFLISNTYCRTKKYFLALASGIPCLSHIWLNECCRTGIIQNYQDYLLPAGRSEEDDCLVEWNPDRNQILAGMKVMTVSDDKVAVKSMRSILIAAGCELVNTLPSSPGTSEESIGYTCDVVITDPSCPRQVLNEAHNLDIPVVSLEWLMQSLINGRRVGYYNSAKYEWDYREASPS